MGKWKTICITLLLLVSCNIHTSVYEMPDTSNAQKVIEVQEIELKEPLETMNLSKSERDYICRIVYAEAGGEGLYGQTLIAQCIFNSTKLYKKDPITTIKNYGYTRPAKTYTDETERAVEMVFDEGYRYTDEPIQYFYACNKVNSRWHENQDFVLQYHNVRFFK